MPMRGGGIPRGAVLVGFMGAGKSAVGEEVARRLGAEFVDVDDRIEARAGKRVQEIFASEGEQAFRERERDAIRDAVSVPGRVIATGGGAFLDPGNRRALRAYAPVIFLDVSPPGALARPEGDTSRPPPSGEERGNPYGFAGSPFLRHLLRERSVSSLPGVGGPVFPGRRGFRRDGQDRLLHLRQRQSEMALGDPAPHLLPPSRRGGKATGYGAGA